jgi:hypothetical protein
MPDRVVAAADEMAGAQAQPLIGNTGPNFEWSPGIMMKEESNNSKKCTCQNIINM